MNLLSSTVSSNSLLLPQDKIYYEFPFHRFKYPVTSSKWQLYPTWLNLQLNGVIFQIFMTIISAKKYGSCITIVQIR